MVANNITYLLLGGNLHNVQRTFKQAIQEIEYSVGNVTQKSNLYQSKPWGFESNHLFLNQVIEVKTALAPIELLKKLLSIETQLGRIRPQKKHQFTSRVIDIDILYFNNEIVQQKELTIPHHAIPNRLFTLIPLTEIAPHFVHPILKKTNYQLTEMCTDTIIPTAL